MNTPMHSQRGVIMVLTALFIVVLVGIGALSLDLGRLFILKTQMQNAVDAAALAAAVELRGQAGDRGRAIRAAQEVLSHKTAYANNVNPGTTTLLGNAAELLAPDVRLPGDDGNPDDTTDAFEFFSDISTTPLTPDDGNAPDASATFVRVTLDPRQINLFFLPVLSMLNLNVGTTAQTAARALAGTQELICDYPPMALCDPFEQSGLVVGGVAIDDIETAVAEGVYRPGDMTVLKFRNDWQVPGNFGFLCPGTPPDDFTPCGATQVGNNIAFPPTQDCTIPIVQPKTGSTVGHTIWAWNSYFDAHKSGSFPGSDPAQNVIEYPDDLTTHTWDPGDGRFWQGDWRRYEAAVVLGTASSASLPYWNVFHDSTTPPTTDPIPGYDLDGNPDGTVAWADASRWDVCNWELSSGNLPCDPRGKDPEDPADDITCPGTTLTPPWHTVAGLHDTANDDYKGNPPPVPDGAADGSPTAPKTSPPPPASNSPPISCVRRTMFVAILRCIEENVHGASSTVPVETFTKYFLSKRATQGGSNEQDFTVEFMGIVGRDADIYREIVQLYQ